MSTISSVETNAFPKRADLEGIIQEGCFSSLRKLLREEGIFISCQKEQLASILSRYLLSDSFYRAAFGQIHRKEHGLAITGVRFERENLDGIFEKIQELRNIPLEKNRYSARFVSVSKRPDGALDVQIQYDKINPRFVVYNRREIYTIDACIKIISDGCVEVSAKQSVAADAIVVRELAHDLVEKVEGKLISIDLLALPVNERVDLFDDLVKDDTRLIWRIEKCCGFSIRKDDDDRDVLLPQSQSEMLYSAILEGENLRDHAIVKSLLADGYYFSSATFFTYSQSRTNYHIKLKVDFKKSPDVLVVTAHSARVYDENDKFEGRVVEKVDGEACVQHFWNLVHSKYFGKIQTLQSTAKSVVRDDEQVSAIASTPEPTS